MRGHNLPLMRNRSVQPMQIYLFTGGVQSEELNELVKRLSEALPDLAIVSKLSDVPISPAHGSDPRQSPVYIIVPFLNTASPLDRVISIAEQEHPGTFFIFVSKEISASEYKRLTKNGSADWVSLNGAPHEILDILSRRNSLAPTAAAGEARQTKLFITGFVPSGGGVGNTTLALETAVQLKLAKGNRPRRICYLDLDVQTSHVCDYLDIEPRLKMDEIVKNPERLDDQLFALFVSSHSSGLDVLATPRHRDATSNVSIGALDALFRVIARRYDLLILDLPPLWFEWTPQVLSVCDLAVVTGLNTVAGLRQVSDTLEAVRGIESPAEAGDCRSGALPTDFAWTRRSAPSWQAGAGNRECRLCARRCRRCHPQRKHWDTSGSRWPLQPHQQGHPGAGEYCRGGTRAKGRAEG